MKLVKLLANLGYGSRKDVQRLIRYGAVTDASGRGLGENELPPHDEIRFKGETLDPAAPLTLILNKPAGYTCSADDPGRTIYELLPPRFAVRNPGKLLHRIIHPKSRCRKVYHAALDRPLSGKEAALFASGTLMLNGESKPLLPAPLEVLGEKEALVTLHEGRYHQVRRMFAAADNHVVSLRRLSIGGLSLPTDLAEGEWRELAPEELDAIFAKGDSE
jgi:16S rRNA pseudouridine516 synthase